MKNWEQIRQAVVPLKEPIVDRLVDMLTEARNQGIEDVALMLEDTAKAHPVPVMQKILAVAAEHARKLKR